MMINTICYKLKTPQVYNRGTPYEKSCDEFLVCYGFDSDEENERFVDKLNNDICAKEQFIAEKRMPYKANEIDYFFSHKQEPFDTRGN